MKDGIRLATAVDGAELLSIYAPYIRDTVITLEFDVPALEEYRDRIAAICSLYPYLVWIRDEKIVGYAYAAKFHERPGYAYGASTSVYLHQDAQGGGIGRRLYGCLLDLMQAQGLRIAYAITTLPNEKSLALQASFGFSPVGVCRRSGRKHGKWLDVMWQEKFLGDFPDEPLPVIPIGDLPDETRTALLEKWTSG